SVKTTNIKMFSQGPGIIAELVAKCLQAREMAYCSYSGFPVGAAQHDSTNCDTESESFHLTNSDIKDSFVGPCGACRQVLMEVWLLILSHIMTVITFENFFIYLSFLKSFSLTCSFFFSNPVLC
uniref:Zgc:103586 n=1 Tax=Sinocyclocheilus rhinocerous TaxID=307959 RepID=A0A673J3G0_9TELE